MAGSLQNKIAIVTGAGRGIGAATAELFVSEGAKVVLASRSEKELSATASGLVSNTLIVPTDVSDEAHVKKLFDRTIDKFGRVDILINNAGTFHAAEFSNLKTEDWDRVINVNLRGTFLCSREAFRRMKNGGSIVNISSMAGVRGAQKFKGFSSYVAAKAAVIGFTEALAVDGADLNIRVNCVAPGAVETRMLKEALPSIKTEAKPVDIAKIILNLCQDTILTGAIVEVRTRVT